MAIYSLTMTNRKLLPILGILFLTLSCNDQVENHPILKYYPPSHIFEEGYACKFYNHYYPKNTNTNAETRIAYAVYKKLDDKSFSIQSYNAGFELTGENYFHIDEHSMYLDSSSYIWRGDTTIYEVEKNLMSKWDVDSMPEAHYRLNAMFDENFYQTEAQQKSSYDSLINGLPAKVFKSKESNIYVDEDTTRQSWIKTSIFVEGLGFFGSVEDHEAFTWEVELVEQMSLSEFKERADHDVKRIAYIDPEKALDKGSDFEICGLERFIADYYNSTPDGDYIHGKAALVDTILTNLDPEKMMNQTGMLTFRFVVNCEGKAGRFIAEGYDYDYQPMEFPEETINHLYEQLLRLEEWQPVVNNDEARDAYFYFTFKMTNGEITDILP